MHGVNSPEGRVYYEWLAENQFPEMKSPQNQIAEKSNNWKIKKTKILTEIR